MSSSRSLCQKQQDKNVDEGRQSVSFSHVIDNRVIIDHCLHHKSLFKTSQVCIPVMLPSLLFFFLSYLPHRQRNEQHKTLIEKQRGLQRNKSRTQVDEGVSFPSSFP